MHSLLPPRSILDKYCFYPFQLHVRIHEMQEAAAGESGSVPDPGFSSPNHPHLPDLLIECADAVSQGEWQRSISLIRFLCNRVSVHGDSSERVMAQFADSLSSRVIDAVGDIEAAALVNLRQPPPSAKDFQAAYLAFNQIAPFTRFSHLTANQAILEALEGSDMVHIVDLEIMQGVQWPPLMQALAERSGAPPSLRLSGAGSDMDVLEQTGNRLTNFATTLGLPFEFHAIHANRVDDVSRVMLAARPGEALAVNCVVQLHHRWPSEGQGLRSFLRMIHSLQPRVVTLVDREVNCNHPEFIDRFRGAFQHYAALYDSLEATLPPRSTQRSNVERVWLGSEITSIIAVEGMLEMHQSYSNWRSLFRSEGFNWIPHSTFALSQARLLLRLHYPSEGYQLREEDDCLMLGWQDVPLFAVSAWN